MNIDEIRYLPFPLSLMRKLFTNKFETLENILNCGIYVFSMRNKPQNERVARQLIYDMYQEKLTGQLNNMTWDFIERDLLTHCSDYKGFNCGGGEFTPETETAEVLDLFEKYPDFYYKAVEHYRLHAISEICKFLDVTLRDARDLKNKAVKLLQQIPTSDPYPFVSIKLLFDFRDNEKSEFDLIQLAAYIAINSILGEKKHIKTNKGHILARMFGYSSTKTVPATLPPLIAELFEKYSHRYHFEKIIKRLETSWNITVYSHHNRGFWISKYGKTITRENALKQLILTAETQKKKNKDNGLKLLKNDIREKVLQQLK